MRKLTKAIATVLLGTLLLSETAFAADVDTPVQEVMLEETQTISDYIVEGRDCSTSKGELWVLISCNYTAQWNEGDAGWISNASFELPSAWMNNKEYKPEVVGISWISGSSAYQRYRVNGVSILVSVTCDKWGNVTLGVVEN